MTSCPGDVTASQAMDVHSSSQSDQKFNRSVSPLYGNLTAACSNTTKQVVTVGICAMEKKSLSKPMKEILTRIAEFEYIKTIIFPESVILQVRIHQIFTLFHNIVHHLNSVLHCFTLFKHYSITLLHELK